MGVDGVAFSWRSPTKGIFTNIAPPGHVARLNPIVANFALQPKRLGHITIYTDFPFNTVFLGKSSVQTTNPKRFLTCFVVEFARLDRASLLFKA